MKGNLNKSFHLITFFHYNIKTIFINAALWKTRLLMTQRLPLVSCSSKANSKYLIICWKYLPESLWWWFNIVVIVDTFFLCAYLACSLINELIDWETLVPQVNIHLILIYYHCARGRLVWKGICVHLLFKWEPIAEVCLEPFKHCNDVHLSQHFH